MTFLKGFGLAILSLLLFLSLSLFGVGLTIDQTLLNPDFAASQVDRLDIASLAKETLSEQISQFEVTSPYETYVAEVMDDTIDDLEPWVREQMSTAIYTAYDYFMGRSRGLSLTVSLEPVKDTLKQNLREAILNSPPPELQELPPDAIEQFLDEAYRQIDEQIPSVQGIEVVEVDQDTSGLSLEQVRQAIGYFHTGYYALIGFSLLLILGIVLINREVRVSTRSLGATFLSCGIFSLVGAFIARDVIATQLAQLDIPFYLQTWIPQLIKDALTPLEIYSIGLLAVGVALLVVSFVYKRRQKTEF